MQLINYNNWMNISHRALTDCGREKKPAVAMMNVLMAVKLCLKASSPLTFIYTKCCFPTLNFSECNKKNLLYLKNNESVSKEM